MLRVAHLTSRFFSSLRPRPVDAQTSAWVRGALLPGELEVWEGFGPADRAESVAVARGVDDLNDARFTAAALLHDAGKQASAFGPFGRAMASVVVAGAGSDRARDRANRAGGLRARIGRYAAHDDLGAERLRGAGARPEVVAWAAAHHRPDRWEATGIPLGICRKLAVADGEPAS